MFVGRGNIQTSSMTAPALHFFSYDAGRSAFYDRGGELTLLDPPDKARFGSNALFLRKCAVPGRWNLGYIDLREVRQIFWTAAATGEPSPPSPPSSPSSPPPSSVVALPLPSAAPSAMDGGPLRVYAAVARMAGSSCSTAERGGSGEAVSRGEKSERPTGYTLVRIALFTPTRLEQQSH